MKNPVSAVMQGLRDLRGDAPTVAPLRDDERLDGRTVLVTGANRGLGLAVSVDLARRGARLLMACRSGIPEAGEAVRAASGSATVEMRAVDLADLRSVSDFVDALARDGVVVDVLVLNAGIVPRESRPTAQGLELMFGVNFLANVALVEGLLARGVLRPDPGAPPRLVFVSSESHRGAGPVDFERLGAYETYGPMGGVRVYGYTKLLLCVYAAELARRLGRGACVHACCPGPVNSDIAREAPAWMKPLLGLVMARFFRSPEEAAPPVTYLSCAADTGRTTGRYLHLLTEKPMDPCCDDVAVGERLVRESRAIVARLLEETTRGAR